MSNLNVTMAKYEAKEDRCQYFFVTYCLKRAKHFIYVVSLILKNNPK